MSEHDLSILLHVFLAWVFLLVLALAILAVRKRLERGFRIECAWCRCEIRAGRGPSSHGICPACSKKVLEEASASEAGEEQVPRLTAHVDRLGGLIITRARVPQPTMLPPPGVSATGGAPARRHSGGIGR